MNRIRRWASLGLLMATLSACSGPAESNDDAARQFLTERNGGTPVAVDGGGTVVGMIEAIDGTTLTVKSPLQGTSTMQINDATKVRKQVEMEQSAIAVGSKITVFGTQTGDTLAADVIQLGDGGVLGSGGVMPIVPDGTTTVAPPASEPIASGGDQMVANSGSRPATGTVTAINAGKLTIKRDDGTELLVHLSDSTTVYQQADVERSELQTGTFVAVSGDRNGDTMTARSIEILPTPSQR